MGIGCYNQLEKDVMWHEMATSYFWFHKWTLVDLVHASYSGIGDKLAWVTANRLDRLWQLVIWADVELMANSVDNLANASRHLGRLNE